VTPDTQRWLPLPHHSVLRQMVSVLTSTSYFCKAHFNIMLISASPTATKWCFHIHISDKFCECTSSLLCMMTFLKFPSLEHCWESSNATSSTSRCGRRSRPLCRCSWVVKSCSLSSSSTNAPISLLSGSANLFCLFVFEEPVSYLMGTGSSFPRDKVAGA
jgi:hypothetical protein